MKKSCLSAALVLTAIMVVAQESPRAYRSAIKLYNLTDWEDYTVNGAYNDTNFYVHRDFALRILHPTIAYQWQSNKGHYHEIELITLQVAHTERFTKSSTPAMGNTSQTVVSEITTRAALSVRYEYQMSLRPQHERPWDLSLGVGVNPYYFFQIYSAEISTVFPTSVSTFGTRVFAVPRFTWHLSPRIFLDVNIPICLGEYRHQSRYNESPVIPISERRKGEIDFTAMPALYSGRIGIGVKLN